MCLPTQKFREEDQRPGLQDSWPFAFQANGDGPAAIAQGLNEQDRALQPHCLTDFLFRLFCLINRYCPRLAAPSQLLVISDRFNILMQINGNGS